MRLKFDLRHYSRQAVEAAAKDFEEYAKFEISNRDGWIWVEAKSLGDELDPDFEGEFSNYVLSKALA